VSATRGLVRDYRSFQCGKGCGSTSIVAVGEPLLCEAELFRESLSSRRASAIADVRKKNWKTSTVEPSLLSYMGASAEKADSSLPRRYGDISLLD